jgi:hypothetical protein
MSGEIPPTPRQPGTANQLEENRLRLIVQGNAHGDAIGGPSGGDPIEELVPASAGRILHREPFRARVRGNVSVLDQNVESRDAARSRQNCSSRAAERAELVIG